MEKLEFLEENACNSFVKEDDEEIIEQNTSSGTVEHCSCDGEWLMFKCGEQILSQALTDYSWEWECESCYSTFGIPEPCLCGQIFNDRYILHLIGNPIAVGIMYRLFKKTHPKSGKSTLRREFAAGFSRLLRHYLEEIRGIISNRFLWSSPFSNICCGGTSSCVSSTV